MSNHDNHNNSHRRGYSDNPYRGDSHGTLPRMGSRSPDIEQGYAKNYEPSKRASYQAYESPGRHLPHSPGTSKIGDEEREAQRVDDERRRALLNRLRTNDFLRNEPSIADLRANNLDRQPLQTTSSGHQSSSYRPSQQVGEKFVLPYSSDKDPYEQTQEFHNFPILNAIQRRDQDIVDSRAAQKEQAAREARSKERLKAAQSLMQDVAYGITMNLDEAYQSAPISAAVDGRWICPGRKCFCSFTVRANLDSHWRHSNKCQENWQEYLGEN